ncbi:hypothetical protein EAE99_001663 [Botrytis elliptica]|nr:hypothetical protein EAE99_001663 [Botrytis elliptica]
MSNDIPNDWFLVKLTRWEDGHETSSALLPVNISAGDTPSGLRNGLQSVYKRIWDYFTVIERDGSSSDRTNLPLGAALRQGDGIEGLSVDWQGLSAGDWPSQRTLVTEFNLPGVVRHQNFSFSPSFFIHEVVFCKHNITMGKANLMVLA